MDLTVRPEKPIPFIPGQYVTVGLVRDPRSLRDRIRLPLGLASLSWSFLLNWWPGSRPRKSIKGEEDKNWNQLEGSWKQFAGSARAHWSKLTDDDWKEITGKKTQLVGRIQQRYGVAKEEAEKQVDHWSDALQDIVEASRKH